jgi:hypothetical protein
MVFLYNLEEEKQRNRTGKAMTIIFPIFSKSLGYFTIQETLYRLQYLDFFQPSTFFWRYIQSHIRTVHRERSIEMFPPFRIHNYKVTRAQTYNTRKKILVVVQSCCCC